MLSTLGSQNFVVATFSHDALRAGTIHPTELSKNGAMPFLNAFMSTIPLPHSTIPLLTVRTNGLIITFPTPKPKNADNKLWINPPFHLIQEVIHNVKQDKLQAILVAPLWDDKPWFQEFQEICVNYIELPRKIQLYARDDTGRLR